MARHTKNKFVVVWKRGLLKITKHIAKLPVNAMKFINNIVPPSMATIHVSLGFANIESSDRFCISRAYFLTVDVKL